MRAYVLHGVGDLRLEERPRPEPRPGWALVKVLAAGICSSDIPRIFQKGTYHFPTIPGHEFCGLVERVGAPEDQGWIGRRVGVYPLIPCKKCPSCAKGEYETCSDYDYIGSRRDGAFGEYVAVPVWNLLALPDAVSSQAGAMLEPAAVALHCVKRLGSLKGKSLCIVGTGAIGMLAGQWALALGAKAAVKGRNTEKAALAERCGLAYLTHTGQEFDCVIEAVGTPETIGESIALAKPGGELALMGNPSGDIPLEQDIYWRILRRQLRLSGTWNSSFAGDGSDWREALKGMEAGRIQIEALVSHMLPFSRLMEGLEMMRDKTQAFCKIMVGGDFACG